MISLQNRLGVLLVSLLSVVTPSLAVAQDDVPLSPWNRFEGPIGHAQLSAGLFVDFFRYGQDEASLDQVGDLGVFDVPEIRMLRIGATGSFNFARPWTWTVFGAYRGFDRGWDRESDDRWYFYDLSLDIPIPAVGKLTIGKTKEPFSLERLMIGPMLPLMERAAGLDALLTARNVGVKLSNTAVGERMTWSGGWFPGFAESSDLLVSSNQWVGRVSGVPINGRHGASLLHVGFSTRYSERRDDVSAIARYRGTPESFGAPDFLDTGDLFLDSTLHLGTEIAWRKGPFWTSSELVMARVESPGQLDAIDHTNPLFSSFHAQASYILTGESRPYDRTQGVFGIYFPDHDINSGGPGMWEVAFRYSRTDLQDARVDGGLLDRWTGALSWTPRSFTRLHVNYGVARLDRRGIVGLTQIFQARLQLFFL